MAASKGGSKRVASGRRSGEGQVAGKFQAHDDVRGVERQAGRPSEVFGYARVSARDQNLARQLDALRAFPVHDDHVFCDKASGRDFERPGYKRLMRRLRPGDVLVVKSIDRLGRNYGEIISEWRALTQTRRIAIVVLDMPLLDTREQRGDVTGVFIADMTLQIMSYVAQVERDNTRQRQAEGIAAARERGVRFGRPRIERPECYEEAKRAYLAGEITRKEAAAKLKVCPGTFDKWLREDCRLGVSGE